MSSFFNGFHLMEGPLFVSFLGVGIILENGRTGYSKDDTYLYSWGVEMRENWKSSNSVLTCKYETDVDR